jgi:hypothetical protein
VILRAAFLLFSLTAALLSHAEELSLDSGIQLSQCWKEQGIYRLGTSVCFSDQITNESFEALKKMQPLEKVFIRSRGGAGLTAKEMSNYLNSHEIKVTLFGACVSACAAVFLNRINDVKYHESLVVMLHGVRGLDQIDAEEYFLRCASNDGFSLSQEELGRITNRYAISRSIIFDELSENQFRIIMEAENKMISAGALESCKIFDYYFLLSTDDLCQLRECDLGYYNRNSLVNAAYLENLDSFACRVFDRVFIMENNRVFDLKSRRKSVCEE